VGSNQRRGTESTPLPAFEPSARKCGDESKSLRGNEEKGGVVVLCFDPKVGEMLKNGRGGESLVEGIRTQMI